MATKRDIPSMRTGAKYSPSGLTELWIEVQRDCDLHCAYCMNSACNTPKETELLTKEEYIGVLDQFKAMGGTTVGIPGSGEPLYGVNLFLTRTIHDYCKQNDLHFVLFTHGMLLTDNLIQEFNDERTSIMLKYNSSDARVQDRLVGVQGYSAKRDVALEKLIVAGFNGYDDDMTTRLGLVNSITTANKDEIIDQFRYCRDHQILPDFDTLQVKGRAARCELKPEDSVIKQIFAQLQVIDEKEYGFSWSISPTYVAGCCERYKNHLYVDRFGKVSPCLGMHLYDIYLGSVRENSLEELWNTSLRKKILARDYTGDCVDCSSFKDGECNSCPRYMDRISCREIHTIGCWNKAEDVAG